MRGHEVQKGSEIAAVDHQVGVVEKDELATRLRVATIDGAGEAGVPANIVDDEARAGRQEMDKAVRRVVIDDDHFEVEVRDSEQAVDSLDDGCGRAVGRDDDANLGPQRGHTAMVRRARVGERGAATMEGG